MWNYQKCNNSTFIQRLKRKKEDALEYVIEQYLSLVKGVVLKTLPYQKNFGIVEECINDVFLAVWNNADQFVGNEEDFQRWIAVIAKYKATDQLRKLIRNREDCADPLPTQLQESISTLEEEEQFLNYVSILKEIDRNIFIMKYLLGFKNNEIAERLNLTTQAVENRLYRGKEKISKNFLKEFNTI